MRKIKLLCIFLFIAICLVIPTKTYATSTQRVDDQAKLLSQEEINTLNDKIEKIQSKYNIDLAIVTTNNKQGKTIKQYTIDYYDNSNLSDDAMVFAIAMDTREWYILSQGYCVEVMHETRYDDVESAIIPSLTVGNYYYAFSSYINNIDSYFKQATTNSNASNKQFDSSTVILGSFVAGPAIAFMILSFHKRAHRSVIAKHHASDYLVPNSFSLDNRQDRFLYSNTTRTRKPEPKQQTTHTTRSSSSSGKRSGRGGSF